jgi:peptidoglycan/LPS O-acetylase OafA/YrhL
MDFRADINGLRAIAVLAVLAFHFGVPGAEGGFVGVDVFFVISGYLMTGIILGRLDKGSFSVPGFYLDRGRRIVPPLLVLIVAVLAGGLIWLLPQELLALVTFLSNFLFWKESGYFAPAAKLQLLLHTWSLSAEWQFYILYPLLILPLHRMGGRKLVAGALIAIALASFAICVALTITRPTAAFFLLPARAWEMIAGGLGLLAPALPPRATRPAQLGGFGLILVSILLARSESWPGAWALMPVLGTVLVIAARRTDSQITSNPVVAWFGLNSYSIYLWHWPLAVIAARSGMTGDWRAITAGFTGSLLLGHLSWRFVERGGRRHVTRPRVHTAPLPPAWERHARLIVLCGVFALIGAGIWKARGLPQRFSPEVRALEQDVQPGGPYSAACFNPKEDRAPCILGLRTDRAVATLIGDSHAEADASAVVAALPADAAGGLAFSGSPACTPLLGAISTDPENRCDAYLRHALVPLTRPRITPVIVISHWSGAIEGRNIVFSNRSQPWSLPAFRTHLLETSCALAKAGPTWIMLPTPDFPFPVAATLQRRLTADPHTPEITVPLAEHRRRTAVASQLLHEAARQCGVGLLDPIPYLCPDGRTCIGSRDHRAVVRDTHHMTEYGNRLLVPLFRQVLTGVASQAKPDRRNGF